MAAEDLVPLDADRCRAAVELPRPQPLGVLPLPAGLLLIGGGEASEPIREMLCAGRLPASWPTELAHVALALAGDFDAAVASITGDDPISVVNRFVLRPERAGYDALDLSDPALVQMVDAVAYVVGLIDTPPSAVGVDGEIAGFVHLVRASHRFTAGDTTGAVIELSDGAAASMSDSPILAGHLLATLAQTLHRCGGATASVLCHYDDALSHFQGSDHLETIAELWLHRALAAHELSVSKRELLAEAIEGYQRALGLFDRVRHGQQTALARANLARAFHALPATDARHRLRAGLTISATVPLTVIGIAAQRRTGITTSGPARPDVGTEPGLMGAIGRYESLLASSGARIADDAATLNWAHLLAEHRAALDHLHVEHVEHDDAPRFEPVDVTFMA
jgi:hypothetical protein